MFAIRKGESDDALYSIQRFPRTDVQAFGGDPESDRIAKQVRPLIEAELQQMADERGVGVPYVCWSMPLVPNRLSPRVLDHVLVSVLVLDPAKKTNPTQTDVAIDQALHRQLEN